MPKEYIYSAEFERVKVGWSADYVEIATMWDNPQYAVCAWDSQNKRWSKIDFVDQGWFVPLPAKQLNRLIKILKKARRKAYKYNS